MIEVAQIQFYKHYKLQLWFIRRDVYVRYLVETIIVKYIYLGFLSTERKMIFIFPG